MGEPSPARAPSPPGAAPTQRFRPVGRRLFLLVLGNYILVALVIVGVLIAEICYRADRDLAAELETYRSAFHDPLANYMWSLDREELSSAVQGMARLSGIAGVRVIEPRSREVQAVAGETVGATWLTVERFPLIYRHDVGETLVGELEVYRDRFLILGRVWPAIALLLLTAVLKTLVLWWLFRHFSRRLLERPLARLTEAVGSLDGQAIAARPVDSGVGERNELKVLEEAISAMSRRVAEAVRERQIALDELAEQRDRLEIDVDARTRQLAGARDQAVALRHVAETANQAKSRFLAHMGHELRTPLNAILGFAELIERRAAATAGGEAYGDAAGSIREAGRHLLDLINDLFELSQLDASSLSIEVEALDARELADACLTLTQATAARHGVPILVEIPPGLPPLWADSRAARRMLVNLMSNACRYSPTGRACRLIFAAEPAAVRVSVIDDGAGMTAAQLEEALLPFQQVDRDPYRSHDGPGLGLPLVKALIELHGGRLEIDSEPGKGTRASLIFPAADAAVAQPGAQRRTV